MIKNLTLKLNWTAFFIAVSLVFLVVVRVYAETPSIKSAHETNSEEVAKKYGITFPIAELGNCVSLNECRNFCEDPQNKDACINFAKKKGFYKEQKNEQKNTILNAAKDELGCDSESSCKAFCGEQANWEKCGEFAKKHKISGGHMEDPGKKEILEKAKEVLGCDSVDSCKGFCQRQENRQRCDEFAKLVGLRGGIEHKGPQGMPAYEHAAEQARFCREFPQKCASTFGQYTPKPEYDPAKKCAEDDCSWTGSFCKCENNSPYPSYSPKPTYTPYPTYTPKPTSTPQGGTTSGDENFCNDSDGNGNYTNKGYCTDKNGTHTDYCEGDTARDWYCTGTWNGSSWSNKHCEAGGYVCSSFGKVCSEGACISGSSTPSPTATPQTSGNTGTSSSVKGASTIRSFLQLILDWISK